MNPTKTPSCNVVMVKEGCGNLPAEVSDEGFIASYWIPTDEEKAAIAAGHPVRLSLFAREHPPVAVDVAHWIDPAPAETFQFVMSDDGVMSCTADWRRDPMATSMRLLAADVVLGPIATGAWSDAELQAADVWAYALHLRASDNDDVQVPPRPAHVPAPGGRWSEPGARIFPL